MSKWVPLVVHSEYSVLQSTSTIEKLVERSVEFGFESLAITDTGNMYGAIDFYKLCKKSNIKPIIGMEAFLAPSSRRTKSKSTFPSYTSIFLFAMNYKGYKNLCKLSSIGHLEGFYYVPRIDMEVLKQFSEGILAISGCVESLVGNLIVNNKEKILIEHLESLKNLFKDNFYLQLQSFEMTKEEIVSSGFYDEPRLLAFYESENEKQKKVNEQISKFAIDLGIQKVVTHDSYYVYEKEWKAQEALMNIGLGETLEIFENNNTSTKIPNPSRKTKYSRKFFFKNYDEIFDLWKHDEQSIKNTLEISRKCNLEIDFSMKHYPVFIPPDFDGDIYSDKRHLECKDYLKKISYEGFEKRYDEEKFSKLKEIFPNEDVNSILKSRIDYELDVISSKDMSEYLLIVADFINWAKSQDILVGPGRGSGAGSIICYLIGITDIEPIRFNLLFERFINPERTSYPDIDVDICMNRRHEVINYMVEKYGHDKVAHIITFGKMKARMAMKDVGRVLNIPLSKINALMKKIPEDISLTIDKIIKSSPDIVEEISKDEEFKSLFEIASTLEGCIRNTGIHAAGVIVCGKPLDECIPLCQSKESSLPVTQFSMKPVESVGMLKIDFLGLKTLSCIQEAILMIEKNHNVKLKWHDLNLEDQKAFDLLNSGKTCGVFQMESAGMQDLCKNLHIDFFEEIIAAVSLYRPGPMEMIPLFIDRKHKRKSIEIDHPDVEPILRETYGIMVYQEQVMQIAQKLAGFSLAQGDVLRRAMGKKDAEEMEAQKDRFVKGAVDRGTEKNVAEDIFTKISKFAQYGFNKSHAAAYGYLTYVTAFLKANYTAEWMSALMTGDRHDIDRISDFISDSRSLNISILPPDVNFPSSSFYPKENQIRFALSGIKGVGECFVKSLCDEVKENGTFKNFQDFVFRMLSRDECKINKKTVENLIKAGCFDFTSLSRDQLLLMIDPVFSSCSSKIKDERRGIIDLFNEDLVEKVVIPTIENRTPLEDILMEEKNLLGLFITGNPLLLYKNEIAQVDAVDVSKLNKRSRDEVFIVAFILEDFKVKVSKSQNKKFAIITISDGFIRSEASIWNNYASFMSKVRINQACVGVFLSENHGRISCSHLEPLKEINKERVNFIKSFQKSESLRALKKQEFMQKEKSNNRSVLSGTVKVILNLKNASMNDTYLVCEALRNLEKGPFAIEIICTGHSDRNYILTFNNKLSACSYDEVINILKNFDFVSIE